MVEYQLQHIAGMGRAIPMVSRAIHLIAEVISDLERVEEQAQNGMRGGE